MSVHRSVLEGFLKEVDFKPDLNRDGSCQMRSGKLFKA